MSERGGGRGKSGEKESPKGQEQLHTIRRPGESRQVTQAEWKQNHRELQAAGWTRDEELPEPGDTLGSPTPQDLDPERAGGPEDGSGGTPEDSSKEENQ